MTVLSAMSTQAMVNRTVVLLQKETAESGQIEWGRIGQVVTELADLYTRVRERRLSAAVWTRGNWVVGWAEGGTTTCGAGWEGSSA